MVKTYFLKHFNSYDVVKKWVLMVLQFYLALTLGKLI